MVPPHWHQLFLKSLQISQRKIKTWNHADSSLPDKDITIYVSSGGSGTGIKAVIDGTADFGLVAREVKDSEKQKSKITMKLK